MLILTKPLGVGVLSAAFKQEKLDAVGYAALIATTTQLNTVGRDLGSHPGVHAMTDVTGFGLLGHALEIARGSALTVEIDPDGPAFLPGVQALAQAGIRTGAAVRNWASYGSNIVAADSLPDWHRDLLCDPQTSGGLLIAVAAELADTLLAYVQTKGFEYAAVIGRLKTGQPEIVLAI